MSIFAVGVGDATMAELKKIGDVPHGKHVFYVETFSAAVSQVSLALESLVCDAITGK